MVAGLMSIGAASAVVSLHAQAAPAAKPAAKPVAAKAYSEDAVIRPPGRVGLQDHHPLERPANFGDRQFLTDEEVAASAIREAADAPPDETVPATRHAPYDGS
jgi:hypothetical protein